MGAVTAGRAPATGRKQKALVAGWALLVTAIGTGAGFEASRAVDDPAAKFLTWALLTFAAGFAGAVLFAMWLVMQGKEILPDDPGQEERP